MEKNSQTKSVFTISGRHRFVACVIFVIFVSCAAFAYLASCYKQAQDDIVALQKKDALMFEQVLNSSKNVKSKSSENIDQLQTLLDKHQERQEALLHLEYNKLQADFNVLMFAASCLMIIFLVFSLYSIFKTDEMLNKAETEAKGIHKLLDEAKQTTETITTQCQIMMAQQKGHGMRPPSPVPPLAPQTDEIHSNNMGGERDDS